MEVEEHIKIQYLENPAHSLYLFPYNSNIDSHS